MASKLILTIDGGGIRCLIPALVLVDLQRRLRASGRKLPMNRYVHMLAGAGVGSILVASLTFTSPDTGRTANADNFLDAFYNSAKMFPKRVISSSGVMRLDMGLFEAYLRQYYGDKTLVADAANHLVLPAFDIGNRVPLMITNTDPVTSKFYLWQALRGVIAVVPYMSPALVENRAAARPRGTPLIPLVSGGRYAEDPALAAYVEARKLGWEEEGMTLLSLGTGTDLTPLPYINPQNNVGLDMTDVTEPMLRSADELHCPIATHVNTLMNGDGRAFNGISTRLTFDNRKRLRYFRINGPLRAASQDKIEFSADNIAMLKADAAAIIADHAAILDEVVSRMPTDIEILTEAARLDTLRPSEPTRRLPEPASRQSGVPANVSEFI